MLGQQRRIKATIGACTHAHRAWQVNARTEEGLTALHIAAQTDGLSAPTVNMLLELGLDVNLKDTAGQTALHISADVGNVKLIEKILQGSSAMRNAADNTGRTALHIACMAGETESAHQLVIGKCSITALDNKGYMPVHYAAEVNSAWM
jgi:ankyrin repeat protein